MGRRAVFLLAILILTAGPHLALANGYYKSVVAHPAPPTIPVQRAMIVHRDGVETLVVQSTYQTDSPEVGWILPLPGEPTKIESVDANVLTSLVTCLQPSVVAHMNGMRNTLLGVFAVVTAVSLVLTLSREKVTLLTVLAGLLVLLLCVIMLVPSLNRERGSVSIELIGPAQPVGNYEVQVLRADSPTVLDEWLVANSLQPLGAAETPVFADYIQRKWCFAVARLTRKPDGTPATPHPLAVTFLAPRPVFPMRATSLAGGRTLVELFCVSDSKASADRFDCLVAARFSARAAERYFDTNATVSPSMESSPFELTVGHADAVERMWDGCIVTRLAATLSPAEMQRDIELTLAPLDKPIRMQLYSPRARYDAVISVLLVGGTIVMALVYVAFRRLSRPTRSDYHDLAKVIGVTLVAAGAVYALIPVTDVVESSWFAMMRGNRNLRYQVQAVEKGLATSAAFPESPEALTGLSKDFIARNAFDDEHDILRDRSPGNFDTRQTPDGDVLCFYDQWSREIRISRAQTPTEPAN